MSTVFTLSRLHRAALFFSGLVIVGIFVAEWVRVLPSIGMAGIALTGLVYVAVHRRIAHQQQWPLFGSALLVFFLHLIQGLNTEPNNLADYGRDMVLQLPFLALLLGFWLLPALPGRYLRVLWLLLLGTTVLAAAGALTA